MQSLGQKEKELSMKLDTEGLTAQQVRLIKSMHSLMATVVATDEEGEYFEASAELLKKAAELVKQAQFAQQNKNISYGEQAVEFAVDSLNETIEGQNLQNLDN